MDNRFLFTGLFFVLIILSGWWLSHTGRPLNVLILTLHKLLSVGAVVFLGVTVYRLHLAAAFSPTAIVLAGLTFVLLIALIATGGILSAARPAAGAVLKLHQAIPLLAILSTAVTLYLILVRKL